MAANASSWSSSVLGQYLLQYMDGAVSLQSVSQSRADLPLTLCGGDAVVITKSSRTPSNGACADAELPTLSCTCVRPAPDPSEWTFQLEQRARTPLETAISNTMNASAVLAITAIGRFVLPPQVTTLRLLGEPATSMPLQLEFDLNSILDGDDDISLIQSMETNTVSHVEIANIDLSPVLMTGAFIPPSVAILTARNCNISVLPSPSLFANVRSSMMTLDLSENNLSRWYDDTSMATASISLSTLNLAGNAFTSIPNSIAVMTQLSKLNFSHNPVTNTTVSEHLFDKIRRLDAFAFDGNAPPQGCEAQSAARIAHNVTFCVTISTTATTTTTTSPAVSTTALLFVAIGGTIVIVALATALALLQRRRRRDQLDKCSHTEEEVDPPQREFISFDSDDRVNPLSQAVHRTIMQLNLMDDCLVTKNRLDHKYLQIGQVIKQGGFGTVFMGVYKRRRVAIKKLHRELSCDVKLIESFLKEIALMATLSHPRIVEYIGCAWSTVDHLALVTELVARGDLREVLQHFKQRDIPLTWTNHKLRIALHLAEALQYLHNLAPKVIHRDLKSKNILITSDLDAKLTDFGISREGCFEQTHMTAGVGTSFWIAPEVLAGVRYDEQADIYSFGVVLSELDTDDYPYWNDRREQQVGEPRQRRGETQEGIILMHVLAGEMRPQFTSECPQFIRVLADSCLQDKPFKRPSAAAIAEYLKPLVDAPTHLRAAMLSDEASKNS